MNQSVLAPFSQKVRVRACGVLIDNNAILLVKHEGIGPDGFLWNPPGGGVIFGETITQTIEREFLEETGLNVITREFLGFHEHIGDGLHALELFFGVQNKDGILALGKDPELEGQKQIMTDLRFWTKQEILSFAPSNFHQKVFEFLP